ncbi:MAG TPA: peptidoglycan DD-metalloendopeptidase family protein [Stellaceae bacterium]|nr:peptidoglycan DD-metalloendopeptidase family protein [Stellaceae bacterium]
MSRLAAGLLVVLGLSAVLPGPSARAAAPAAAAAPSVTALAGKLDTVIQQSIAVALKLQQGERGIASLAGSLVGADQDLAVHQRELDDIRTRAAVVLAALERLAHAPPETALLTAQQPVDRIRSGVLLAAVVPALGAEARGLIEKQQDVSAGRAQLIAKQRRLAADEKTLATGRDQLARLIASRDELRQQILHDAAASDPRAVQLGADATDLTDLIKRADAAQESRDRKARARSARTRGVAGADPTRPKGLRVFTVQDTLTPPVAGPVVRRFGDVGADGTPSQGMSFDVLGGGVVVAAFDGRVEYAGPFLNRGPTLIIGHGGGYHSVLAGLGRVDAAIGEWVVAGEPIGTVPGAAKSDESVTIYFELRQNGHPIDPQPSLGGRAASTADHRVNE